MNKWVPDANPKLLLRPHFFSQCLVPSSTVPSSQKKTLSLGRQVPSHTRVSSAALILALKSYTSWLIKFPPDSLSTQVTVSGDLGALFWKGIFPQLQYEAPSQINRFPFFFKSSMLPSPTCASCINPVGHKGPMPTTQFIQLLPTYFLQLIICVSKTIYR